MKDFLRKFVEGTGISPSVVCRRSFDENFADAVNVEWHHTEGNYEAVFYRSGLEHIALFGTSGLLLEYSKKLPPEFLPGPVRDLALSRGEIMNAVLRNKGNMLEYELIVRDGKLIRSLLLISELAELKEERML